MGAFGPSTRAWFEAAFAAPTAVQTAGWPAIAGGDDTLLLAPTGSGKTLAAFLFAIDAISRRPADAPEGYRTIYISPLKALVYDIERNLRGPLAGIALMAERGGHRFEPVRVDIRTGDTSQRDRRRMARAPGEILVTTPESLYLLLGSEARRHFKTVETIIVDEIHALAPTKRGAHMALSVERLCALTDAKPQRIGLSATVRPAEAVGRFLTGGTLPRIVDTSEPPRLDLEIVVPLDDMTRPGPAPPVAGEDLLAVAPTPRERTSVWAAVEPKILELVQTHRSTIVFVNSRGLAERLAGRLNELADEPLVRAHHGSIAHAQRTEIEELLKHGELRGLVATSSLELGIDMGAVDLVVQVESPSSVARALQRVGRAGHGVGEVSKAKIFPKYRGDLLEAAVVARHMAIGEIEPISIPSNPLDVLAQQIVAMCAVDRWDVEAMAALVRRTLPFRDLTDDVMFAVVDMLSGRYPSTEFADLRPRINWDRTNNTLEGRRGARMLSLINGGTIPDRGLFGVHLGAEGPRVGELDEEMVHESRPGETFILGASTWRIQDITRDRVIVEPAPGEPGKMPFWHGDGPGRPIELGRAMGAFVRELTGVAPGEADAWLADKTPLDRLARKNLLAYVAEQREATGSVPSDVAITVERFRDELGDWRVCILSPFGARVHAPWAMALEMVLGARAGFEVQALWTDDGICLRFADADEIPGFEALELDPDEIEDLLVERLGTSSLFAARFRENAGRALLLPRRNPQGRTPLWQQRLRAQYLLAVAQRYPAFPIILETYRTCLKDVFDIEALKGLLAAIQRRDIRIEECVTERPSPFARSLVFAYVAAFLYEGDAPLAERKAQALSLDRELLGELMGQTELRKLLDADVIAEVEAELQGLAEGRRCRHADDLHDLLRRVGALDPDEVRARALDDPTPWLEALDACRRAVRLRVAGREAWIAAEDAALYRDALGAMPPSGIPKALLAKTERPLEELVARFARSRGPFHADAVAAALGLHLEPIVAVLRLLVHEGRLHEGAFHPLRSGTEYCDPDVLRRIRRRTLARLRKAVEPVEGAVLARFLAGWHGVGIRRGGRGRLEDVVDQLEGVALPFSELERRILPARVPDYRPEMLDALGTTGAIVWVGAGSLGPKDGRIRLFRRDNAGLLLASAVADDPPAGELHARVLERLERHGAAFVGEIAAQVGHPSLKDLMEALWDLVWCGQVTNDTFHPLRALRRPTRTRSSKVPRLRRVRIRPHAAPGGRWSLVAALRGAPVVATEQAHALASTLLERYGVVSREAAQTEGMSGGFSQAYPVLREMAEMGKIRRGFFVEGLSGAQFAMAGAVDRLRAERDARDTGGIVVLAATDPANPYGALLPWPPTAEDGFQPKRSAGASVVLVGGEAALWVNPRATKILSFPCARDEDTIARRACAALRELAPYAKGRLLTIEQVDGASPRGTRWETFLNQAGFVADYRGMMLTGS